MRSPIDRKLRPGRLVFYFALILALQAPSASQADSLAAKSGAQLSGKIIELKQGTLAILGNDGTMTTVKWGDISALKINDHVLVTLDTGETLTGLLTVQGGFVSLTSPSLGTVSVAQQRIVNIARKKKEVLPFAVATAQPQEMASVRGRGTGQTPSEEKPAKPKKSKASEGKEENQPAPPEKKVPTIGEKEEKRPEESFLRTEQVLVPQGKLDTEINATYFDRATVPFQGIRDRALFFPLTMRYGITNRFTGLVTVPFAVAWREIPGVVKSTTRTTGGLGDVGFGVQYQVLTERVVQPALMLSLNATSPTGQGPFQLASTRVPIGTGFWQINPGISFVKTVDPVVMFGSLSYSHFFARSDRQPGEAVNPVLGAGFAINDEVALSFKVAGSIYTRFRVHDEEVGNILTPFTFFATLDKYITPNSYLEPSVGIGVTPDAPDFTFSLTYVHRWF